MKEHYLDEKIDLEKIIKFLMNNCSNIFSQLIRIKYRKIEIFYCLIQEKFLNSMNFDIKINLIKFYHYHI